MMSFRASLKILLCLTPLVASVPQANAQDVTQMAFTALQAQANTLVEQGELMEALPLLKELVKRVEATDKSDVKLDFAYFLIGTAHIQLYIQSGNKGELKTTLQWYDKLEKEYPNSGKLKDTLLRRIDVLRAMGDNAAATTLMKKMLGGAYNVRLKLNEQSKLLNDLSEIYYNTEKLAEGLPYFTQLLDSGRDAEQVAFAAAASFEALFLQKRVDEALKLLPILATESAMRYRPRLNVALLKASDQLVEAERLNEAALALSLIKTTDLMIEYHEQQVSVKKAQLDQRIAFGNSEESIEKLKQEIKNLEATLAALGKLPTLRTELLVRRARNYTKTGRRYEAFWMFHDLMVENPKDSQNQFYYYATFSNALKVDKEPTAIEVGEQYRSKFPKGDYYSDISGALANIYRQGGYDAEFLKLAVDFLDKRPRDPVSRALFAQWATFMIERERYNELILQASEWYNKHDKPVYEDGIFYWGGMCELQVALYSDAAASFNRLLEQYPKSIYAEDGLLRKGAAQYYAQLFEEARATLLSYLNKYPNAQSIDQAYFFLGEIENIAGNFELALEYFNKADQLTTQQDVHNSVAFRIGSIYELLERYEEMAAHFQNYIARFGDDGDLTTANYELGRAYELLAKPVAALKLFTENITKYGSSPNNAGVDILIEGYAEKYTQNKAMLESTVALFDQIENDPEFREKFVSDRGFLFEFFYNNNTVDQRLYNTFRSMPEFNKALVEDLTPIQSLMAPYREQLAMYPKQTPEDFFRDALAQAQAKKDIIWEARMLMGLYRLGVEIAPQQAYTKELLNTSTPRLVLYIADYERNKRLDFATQAWNQIIVNYPQDDATIVAFMRLADVYAEKGQPSDALNYLDQIVAQFPGSPKVPAVILRQGDILTQMGDTTKAREKYQYILRVTEWRGVLHARALLQTGESFMADSAYSEAHGFFERTFLAYPHLAEWSARAYLADAAALVELNAKADAITTLKEAIDQLSDSAPADVMESIKAKLKELQ